MIDSGNRNQLTRPLTNAELRARAQTAAELSAHHARLAEKYLLLSRKLTVLADGSAEKLPSSTQASRPRNSKTSGAADRQSEATPDPSQISDAGNTELCRKEFHTTCGEVPTAGTSPPGAESSKPQRSRGNGRPRPRKLRQQVERLWAVRGAGAQKVKVKPRRSASGTTSRRVADEIRQHGRSLAGSLILLCAVLVTLSLVRWRMEVELPTPSIDCTFSTDSDFAAEFIEPIVAEAAQESDEQPVELVDLPAASETQDAAEYDVMEPDPQVLNFLSADETKPNEQSDLGNRAESVTQLAMADRRTKTGRQALLQEFGGSAESEAAVDRALTWLASIQHPAGYWDFANVGPSGNPGTVNNPIGGTAYALLPFLAAGHTQNDGVWQKQVRAGLKYLTQIGVNVPAGYDLRGMVNKQSKDKAPNEAYYVHGAATLAVCEAYAMTRERWLRRPAEAAIQFIINSQHPGTGGWRYNPREPGSTSVTVMQVMALRAGQKAGFSIPDSALAGIDRYLDSVQVDGTGRYGYEAERKRYTGAVTAMALLARIYRGWQRDDGDLRAGIGLLDRAGPYDNLYSLYFSTQVMKYWGGDEWNRWNKRMRDDLVATQITEGVATGSWRPRSGAIHARQGGRLLTTVLATLTLQVYYRYGTPLRQEPAADRSFEEGPHRTEIQCGQ